MMIKNLSCIGFNILFLAFVGFNNLQAQTSKGEGTSKSWVAPKSADKLKNPLAGIMEATKKGKKLFSDNCYECHGDSGLGNGPSAYMLDPKPANLTSEKVQKQSDGAIFWKISEGDNGAMVSYKDSFSEKQRWQLVNYIRQLSFENKTGKK